MKYDIWLQSNLIRWQDAVHSYAYNNYDSCFAGYAGHCEYILDFGASKNVYTVGAWTTRSEYLAADGYTYYPWGFLEPILNTITYFSSPGPSRDGRMKPDIAAPGAVIMSALARTAGGVDPDATVSALPDSEKDPDLQHHWMWGTSMAAPHATGGIALFLQKYPNSSISTVRYYLKQWAKKDGFTSWIGPKGFGAGKLNVLPLKN